MGVENLIFYRQRSCEKTLDISYTLIWKVFLTYCSRGYTNPMRRNLNKQRKSFFQITRDYLSGKKFFVATFYTWPNKMDFLIREKAHPPLSKFFFVSKLKKKKNIFNLKVRRRNVPFKSCLCGRYFVKKKKIRNDRVFYLRRRKSLGMCTWEEDGGGYYQGTGI